MQLRRFYKRGGKYGYYLTDIQISNMRDEDVDEEYIDTLDNSETEILLTPPEQITWYMNSLISVIKDPAYYLENLDFITEFKVGWNNYSSKYVKTKCTRCGKEYNRNYKEKCKCGNDLFIEIHYGVGYLG